MSVIKGNFRFEYDMFHNNRKVIPFNFCVDQEGAESGLQPIVEEAVGVKIKHLEYKTNNKAYIEFADDLSQDQENLIKSIVDSYKNKFAYSDIELIAMSWDLAGSRKIVDRLPFIEKELRLVYDENDWGSYSYIEKKILARWFICDSSKRLEVFSQSQLNDFRYFKIYRGLSPSILEKYTWEDVRKVPYEIDFTKLFKEEFHRETDDRVNGRPVLKKYYFEYNESTFQYNDIFCEIHWDFFDEPGSFLILKKRQLISWYYNDNQVDLTIYKDIGRSYNPLLLTDNAKRIDEGKLRRRNVYSDFLILIVKKVAELDPTILSTNPSVRFVEAENKATQVLPIVKPPFDLWIDVGSPKYPDLIAAIQGLDTSVHAWLLINIPGASPAMNIMEYAVSLIPLNQIQP